jgi:DNA repair protein SbcD/Mre11
MKAEPLFKFVHCADLHLDSPFQGIQSMDPAVAKTLQEATFQSFGNMIDLAIHRRADFIVIAGDIFNEADRSLHAQLRFREMLQKAAGAGLQTFICHGNHDPLSGWEADIRFPPTVRRFGPGEVQKMEFRRGQEHLADLYGISFPERDVRQNLSRLFKRTPGTVFSIGLLHCNLGGDQKHDNYAPCTRADLIEAGMDYWALGHIHASQVISRKNPAIVYPGCAQGLDVLESGPHGCYLVEVFADGDIDISFQATDTVRWSVQAVDISDLKTLDELLDALNRCCLEARQAAESRLALLRFQLCGRGPLNYQLQNRIDPERDLVVPLRESAGMPGAVWVESVQIATRPEIDIAVRRQVDDSVGDFLKAAHSLREPPLSGERIRKLLREKAPRLIAGQIDSLSPSDLQEILETAEQMGLDKLLPEE